MKHKLLLLLAALCLTGMGTLRAQDVPAAGQDSQGFWQLATAQDIVWFSNFVNQGGSNASAKARLIADIDMESSELFQPIGLNNDGSWQKPFMGTFYGNNHIISNLYVKTECEGGLFSRLRGGKIYNLGLVNAYIESTANLRCGAIAGEHHDHAQKDAMAGECAGGHFVNCYTTLPNMSCAYPMDGTQENSYEGVTAEQAATGEICYKLGDAFFQTIGWDTYPELDDTHGKVYPMTASGYATLYNDVTAGTLSDNVTVYTGKKNGTFLSLKKQTNTIPAQTAVVLKGAENYYSFTPAASAPAITGENDLLGTAAPLETTGSEYVLAMPEGEEAGFYLATGTIPAGKAYLTSTSGVKGFIFNEDTSTGIDNINTNLNHNDKIYNLAGQRLQKAQKGVNIINGKKTLK